MQSRGSCVKNLLPQIKLSDHTMYLTIYYDVIS